MPKFKVWFSTKFSPSYYHIVDHSQDAETLHLVYKNEPYLLGISKMDESDIPPTIQERRRYNANHL